MPELPSIGGWAAHTYTLSVQIGLHSIPVTFGVLPPLLETVAHLRAPRPLRGVAASSQPLSSFAPAKDINGISQRSA